MMESVQRAIGVVVGAIVSLILLALMTSVTVEEAIIPLAIGALAAWAWPIVILFWLGRRAKQRREDRMRDEVERQINEQNRG
jgi:hypothetical protein